MKRYVVVILSLMMVFAFVGCKGKSKMPFNGTVTFHSMSVEIPEDFIRDSARSSEDLWAYEQGGYKKSILISRNDITVEPSALLESYGAYIVENGGNAEITSFQEQAAVRLNYQKDELFCREMMFCYGGSAYSIAMRGGTAEEFSTLLDTVELK